MERILGLGFGIETWEKPFALQRLGRYEEKLVAKQHLHWHLHPATAAD
jgi:hypothetical protein